MRKRRSPDYEVGYCRPPVPGQFQPGRSGNPKGRPKKRAATLAEAFTRAFEKPVVVQTSSGRKRTTSLDALAQKMLSDALKGDRHAAKLVLQFAEKLRSDLHQANEDGGG